MANYESVLKKARRYQSELDSGVYLKNGVLVPMDDERKAYCKGFINHVCKNEISKDKRSNILMEKELSGINAAANQILKEKKYKKKKENKKIIDNAKAKEKKKKAKEKKAKEKKKKAKEKKAKEKIINDYKGKEKNNLSPKPGNGK